MAKGPTRRAAQVRVVDDRVFVARNRRARHDYDVLETVEAGIELVGSEVKSLREGKAQLKDSYARVDDGQMWMFGVHVPPYLQAAGFGAHDPDRKRRLLLHRKQIIELHNRAAREGLTLIPLSIYFRDGRAKVELALARGRHTYDKRRALAERDAQRETERAFVGRVRAGRVE
jgi:SsrA-binding protein